MGLSWTEKCSRKIRFPEVKPLAPTLLPEICNKVETTCSDLASKNMQQSWKTCIWLLEALALSTFHLFAIFLLALFSLLDKYCFQYYLKMWETCANTQTQKYKNTNTNTKTEIILLALLPLRINIAFSRLKKLMQGRHLATATVVNVQSLSYIWYLNQIHLEKRKKKNPPWKK